jgi:nitrite reductase (NO-forming)/hydroxylamine reductase
MGRNQSAYPCRRLPLVAVAAGALFSLTGPGATAAADEARDLFQRNCAVCHGADRGGYIAPALNRDSLVDTTKGKLAAKIITGGLTTLMLPHPTFFGKLSRAQVELVGRCR